MLICLVAGCYGSSVAPPAGDSPLRYRDAIFPNVTVTKDLTYGQSLDLSNNVVDLKLDLYQPTGDTATSRPAVVWVHGGGFSGGDKGSEGYLVTPLVKEGYVGVSINYRLLAPGGCTGSGLTDTCVTAAAAGINDGRAAVRWLRANAATYGIDPTRIAVEGFSAGGIIATGVGLTSDQPANGSNPTVSSRVGAWLSVSGGLPGGEFADATDSPGYLFSGTADPTVPYQWSKDTADVLDKAGVFVVLNTEQGVGHQLPDLNVLATQATNFFYKELDLAHA